MNICDLNSLTKIARVSAFVHSGDGGGGYRGADAVTVCDSPTDNRRWHHRGPPRRGK